MFSPSKLSQQNASLSVHAVGRAGGGANGRFLLMEGCVTTWQVCNRARGEPVFSALFPCGINRQLIHQLPLTSPQAFSTNQFNKGMSMEITTVLIYLFMSICMFVLNIMTVHFCFAHSKTFIPFPPIWPKLNRNNTVFREGRGHPKSFVTNSCPPPFSQ